MHEIDIEIRSEQQFVIFIYIYGYEFVYKNVCFLIIQKSLFEKQLFCLHNLYIITAIINFDSAIIFLVEIAFSGRAFGIFIITDFKNS